MKKKDIDITVEGAGIGKRFSAYLIDMAIIVGIYLVYAGIIGVIAGEEEITAAMYSPEYAGISVAYRLIMVGMPVIAFIYGTLCEAGKRQATVGKRAMKQRIVCGDGSRARTIDIVVRNIVKWIPALLGAVFTNPIVQSVAGIWMIAAYIVPVCNKKRRGIHDFAAGTIVTLREAAETEIPPIHITLPEPPFGTDEEQAAGAASTEMAQDMREAENVRTGTYHLLCVDGMYAEGSFLLDEPIVLGRDPKSCNITFDNEAKGISRVHCRVSVENQKVFLEDMGSSYGTMVNGCLQIKPHERVQMGIGDRFTIGKRETFVVQ